MIHHLLDAEDPHGIVARYPEARANSEVLTRSLGRGQVRSRQEIVRFFDGLDLVPPGVVFLPYWRPAVPVDGPPPAGSMLMLVGVARKP
jgi:hypothetical protein